MRILSHDRSWSWVAILLVITPTTLLHAGPVNYWQQRVSYDIDVTLDADAHRLVCNERLAYENNSPHTLEHIWFHLYPNAYKDGKSLFAGDLKRVGSRDPGLWPTDERGHIEVLSFTADGHELKRSSKPGDEVELKVELPAPLEPGGTVVFEIGFNVKIPKHYGALGHRMGYRGAHYEISQWYPKPVVYDTKGWHPDSYRLSGEFYGEFGTFDVIITVPENMTVAATGDLIAPQAEVVRLDSLARLGARLDSLRTAKATGEIKSIHKRIEKAKLSSESKTLRFRAENVHDFAWAADKDFILKRDYYRDVTINVFVRPKLEEHGRECVGFTYDALENYSRHYGEYPYSQMSVVDGDLGGGMEYPNLTISDLGGSSMLRMREVVITHETGHNWFYGMLGSDEMAEAWLDEGMNCFAENRYLEDKYGREANLTEWPRWLGFMPGISDRYYQMLEYYLVASNGADKPVLTNSAEFGDLISYVGMVYGKGSQIMDMLKTYLGDETFDQVMQTYFVEFQYKHPTTEDFVNVAERVSGTDLDWFFDQWLRTTGECDLAVSKVEKQEIEQGAGKTRQVAVTVCQRGQCRMPADLIVRTKDGQDLKGHWEGTGADTTLTFEVSDWPAYVWVDPDDKVLELNNWNNRSPRSVTFHAIGDLPSFESYQIFYGPSLWYDDDVDGWRPGLWLNGGQFRSRYPLQGAYDWTVGASYGTRSDKINYRVSLGHPLKGLGRLARFGAVVKDLEGRVDGEIGIDWRRRSMLVFGPELRLKVGLYLQNVYNTAYMDTSDWSDGRVAGVKADLVYSSPGYRVPISCGFHMKAANEALGSDFEFLRAAVTVGASFRWTRWIKTGLRLYGGYVDGDPPLQERIYLSGGLVPEGPLAFVADRKGDLAPQDHFHVPGDANLRGYYGQHVADKLAGSLSLDLWLPRVPVALFYDLGNVWQDCDRVSWDGLKQNAGVAVHLGPVGFHFPIWVSDPPSGEKESEYRWLVSTHMPL